MVEVVYQRLAELTIKQRTRGLTQAEAIEFTQCLTWNINHCYRMALLENYSLMASMTRDTDWQHEICRDIDET